MKIEPFAVEEWMNAYESGARYNIAETCVNSVSLNELLAIAGESPERFWQVFGDKRLTYGYIEGAPELREGICRLYSSLAPDEVITTHGAAGADHHVFYSLIEAGDEVISIMPTYQQLYSIPASFGAQVKLLHLQQEQDFLPDLSELRAMVTARTKLICINNPNNPTGALMSRQVLEEIVEIAKEGGAYILCDEVYRNLTQRDEECPSIVDLYEKGISVSSMSKVFSLAGIRMGWIAAHDKAFLRSCMSHRDYNLVSCGMFDEEVAALALRHAEVLLARNRRIVRENLSILDAWVQSVPQMHYTKPQAGTTALVYYDLPVPSYDFCKGIYEKTGAFVTPGDCFGQPFSFRIGYACAKEELIAGLGSVAEYVTKWQ